MDPLVPPQMRPLENLLPVWPNRAAADVVADSG